MLIFGDKPETLPVSIQRDATTGLPLLSERDAVMQIILAYLALPYSVVEYGCGKKASLIIDQLLALEIPPYALARGMILERDMSPLALEETNSDKRPHALVADNPLNHLIDIADPRLGAVLEQNTPGAQVVDNAYIQAAGYSLSHAPQVQFVTARSHIYTIVTFWDEDHARTVEQVIDPSLHRSRFFAVEAVRDYLHAPEGLLFDAPLLARFRLDPDRLTTGQAEAINGMLPAGRRLRELDHAGHARLVRELTGAEAGSIGDPDTWTYANNIRGSEYRQHGKADDDHIREQEHDTGRGDAYREARRRLFHSREQRSGEASAIVAQLRETTEASDVRRIAKADADWSAHQLEPLADAATTFAYFNSLHSLADAVRAGSSLLSFLDAFSKLQSLRGTGVRLRRRIDWLGRVSREADGRIDARALTPGFTAATVETIRQMNRAGLTVFIDRVGNLHGLLLDDAARAALDEGRKQPADFTRASLCHCSHIDTVNDAGKFDGRLGVLAGVETAHVMKDLERHFDLALPSSRSGIHTQVSAFIGEEMTFTGGGISMPGSAAVAGRATPEQVYAMRNGDGERFGDCLQRMLRELQERQHRGDIILYNHLQDANDGDELTEACSDPTHFFTPHTYERHIEQGPFLDRSDAPIVMVGTIMGIHQEDFLFRGARAEAAALELNRRMRELTHEDRFRDVRITVGMLEGRGQARSIERVYPALRWTFEGELNHAGATPTADRRDPGVAAGRMARTFLDWFDRAFGDGGHNDLHTVIGNVRFVPGTNRNVIPGSVSMTLALAGEDRHPRASVDDFTREDLTQTLEGYAVGTLARRVAGGGEGVRLCRVEPVSYTNIYAEARLSIDLRSAEQAVSTDFRRRITDILAEIEAEFAVETASELQQQLQPFTLEKTGQVLLMERSYGGSHNPRETELLSDIVRGCILQIAITREVLEREALDGLNLFRLVESRIPNAWLGNMARFTSGALHDTCNIAARATRS